MIRDIVREAELFDIPGQAVIATDVAGAIHYWSAEAERLYGWSREEVLGRPITEVTPSDLSRDEAQLIMRQLRRGQSWSGSFQVKHRTGATFHARVVDVPVRDASGALVGIVGISRPADAAADEHGPAAGGGAP